MDSWQMAWRNGILPQVSVSGLISLKEALKTNDRRLQQGATTNPPPLMCVKDWPVEGCCPIGFTGWKAQDESINTVGEVEEHFAKVCYNCDKLLGEPAACRYFLNWWDTTPREEAFKLLLEEVELALANHQLAV